MRHYEYKVFQRLWICIPWHWINSCHGFSLASEFLLNNSAKWFLCGFLPDHFPDSLSYLEPDAALQWIGFARRGEGAGGVPAPSGGGTLWQWCRGKCRWATVTAPSSKTSTAGTDSKINDTVSGQGPAVAFTLACYDIQNHVDDSHCFI